MITTIANGRVFDGHDVLGVTDVHLDGDRIVGIGGIRPAVGDVVDATGCTLLPGLIDAHTHTNPDALRMALTFGVTTELEMQGTNTRYDRAHISGDDSMADVSMADDSMADVRSSGFGISPPGGHPDELVGDAAQPLDAGPPAPEQAPGGSSRSRVAPIVHPRATTPREAVAFIGELVAAGSDYIKFMVDDGSVEGHPGLPMLDPATLRAGITEAQRQNMLTLAHALTVAATASCIDAGIDGLAHVFMDRPHSEEIIEKITAAGAFVIPCVTVNASLMGITGAALADDPRVAKRLDGAWDDSLRRSYDLYPQGRLDDVLATVRALHDDGVDLLIGTDAAQLNPSFGGVAHGASVHQELRYFVQAGLTPVHALRAATSTTAGRFDLHDRGRIATGLRADLLLVDGDPTIDIDDTLNIRNVWRRGSRLIRPRP